MALLILCIIIFAIVASVGMRLVFHPYRSWHQIYNFVCKPSTNSRYSPSNRAQKFDTYFEKRWLTAISVSVGKVAARFIVFPIVLVIVVFISLMFMIPVAFVQAAELDWDVVDWPDPPPPITQTTFTGIGGGDITITFDLDPDCLSGSGPNQLNPNDTPLITGGLPVIESLLILVDYSNPGCTQSFVDITIDFTHPGGVNNLTIPILDIDQDPNPGQGYVDEIFISATDGTNTYLLNHPQTVFTVTNPISVTANLAASTFTANPTQPAPVPNDQPDGNASVTFNQPGIQRVSMRYQNPRTFSGQGISFGVVFFNPSSTQEADLQISKVSQPKPYVPGDPITYTITVTNLGPSTVNGITVTDNLPLQIQGPAYTPSTGTYDPATGAWNVTLNSSDTANLTIVGTVDAGFTGTLQNAATVQSREGISDPDPSNNVFTDTNTLTLVDPSITKQASVSQASPGDQVLFQVTISNPSPGDATQVVLTDPLPLLVALDNYSFASTPAGLVTADNVVTQVVALPPNHPSGITETIRYTVILTVPTLASGDRVDLFLTTTVTAVANPGPQNIENTATMNFAEGPPRIDTVRVSVPGPASSSQGGGGDSGGDDDDDDDAIIAPPPSPTPQPTVVPQPAPTLPVLLLPETGLREAQVENGLFDGAFISITFLVVGMAIFLYVWKKLK